MKNNILKGKVENNSAKKRNKRKEKNVEKSNPKRNKNLI
jgi:hypothetical protein